jgi:hypothetical protein
VGLGRTAALHNRAPASARAGNRRFSCLSALRAHTKVPYKTDLHRKTLRNAKGAYPPRVGADRYQTR